MFSIPFKESFGVFLSTCVNQACPVKIVQNHENAETEPGQNENDPDRKFKPIEKLDELSWNIVKISRVKICQPFPWGVLYCIQKIPVTIL